MSRRHLAIARIPLAAAALTLVAASCGSSGGASTDPQFGAEEFGLTFAELSERSDQVEAAVSTCMSEAGFEYVPVDFETVRSAMTSDKTAPGLSAREFTDQFGYGVTTQTEKPIVERSLGSENRRIVDALADADRTAYLRALYGPNDDATFAFALELEDFSRTGGCTRSAIEQFFTREQMLATYRNPGDAQIDADPRTQQALAEFADCMAAAGYPHTNPDQVEDGLWEDFDALVGDRDPTELTGADAAALAELQTYELTLAPVANQCENSLVEPVIDNVEREIYGTNPG